MLSRAIRLLAPITAAVLLFLITPAIRPAPAHAQETQAVAACPVAVAPNGIEVCVDRGDGARYLDGDPITICVTVTLARIAIFPPPPDPVARITSFIDGVRQGVIFEQRLSDGQRCISTTIGPPFGQELLRAELLQPDGTLIASDSVSFTSAARGVPTPPARFSGTVTLNGQPAPAGTRIEALIGRQVCGVASVTAGATYVVDVASAAVQPGCGTDGATVAFNVGSLRANETGTFQTGAFVTLNLTAGRGQPQPQPPAAPTNLRATALDTTRVRLDWTDNAFAEDGFRLFDGFTLIATLGPNSTAYIITGLEPNSYHCFRVLAFAGGSESPSTDWACVTLPPTAPPPDPLPLPPSGLQATPAGAGAIRLDWVDTSRVEDGFRLFNGGTLAATLGPNSTAYIATGLPPGSWNCFRLVAFNAVGESASTDWACATAPTGGAPPARPLNLAATALDPGRILLTWTDASANEDGFRIWNGITTVATLGPDTTGTVLGGFAPGSWSCFQVLAFNGSGDSAWTDWACAATPAF